MPLTSPRDRARVYALLLVVVAAYLLYARTRTVSETFLLLRDQIRDWQIAMGSWSDLPLTGPQSTAGGSSLGPIYYWLLWAIRHLIGPWTHGLPHAGAIGIAILQTAADLLLLHALVRSTGSLWLACGAVLFGATASHDLAVTATIWNPAVSVAFVKVALAMLLLAGDRRSWWWMAGTIVPAWLAVQAHSAALFVAAPVIGACVLSALPASPWIAAWQRLRTTIEVILVLQAPFIYKALTAATADVGPTRVMAGATTILKHPSSIRLRESLTAFLSSSGSILMKPWPSLWWWPLALAIAAVALIVRSGRHAQVMSVTLLPIAAAILGFSLWPGAYDEYWYLPVVPCIALTIAMGVAGPRGGMRAIVFALSVVALQPSRLADSLTWYRMPAYGPLARGSLEIRRRTATIRRIDTTFVVPPLSDREFLYRTLGGRVSPEAGFDALIAGDGEVRFTSAK